MEGREGGGTMLDKAVSYLLKQKLLVGLVVVLIALLGVVSALSINREAYPEVNFDMVQIVTVYPGGSPDEIESFITIPLEEELREVTGIDKVRSYNIENLSVIAVFIEEKARDKRTVVQDIKDAVDAVKDLPAKAERPTVTEIKLDKTPILDIGVLAKGEGVPYADLRDVADDLEDLIYDLDGIADVTKYGYRDREFLVEVDPRALTRYRIDLQKVIDTLNFKNIDMPGGTLKVGREEYILRTLGQFKSVKQIEDTVIQANDAGFLTRVRDVAKVRDGFEDPEMLERVDGRPAIRLKVNKKRVMDEIRMVERLRAALAGFRNPHPETVELKLFEDTSRFTKDRIESVLSNAVVGFVLLGIVLLLLLGPRLSLILSTGMPIAFLIAFFGLKLLGVTFQVISLFGMIMVLGMIVDFGIVVIENAHRYMEEGMERSRAIVKGVTEVLLPVTVTLVCICTAFMPLLLLSGLMGKFINAIPIVLILCLSASWFAALFILPVVLDLFGKHVPRMKDDRPREGLFDRLNGRYRGFLAAALEHRYVTLVVLTGLLIVTLFAVRFIGFSFVPGGGENLIRVYAKLPVGTNLETTRETARRVEEILLTIPEEEREAIQTTVGTGYMDFIDPKPGDATNKMLTRVKLVEEKDRKRKIAPILHEMQEAFARARQEGRIRPDAEIEVDLEHHGPPVGKAVNVEIRGEDPSVMRAIGAEYLDFLKGIEGVVDAKTDEEPGKEEFRYSVDEALAKRSGLSVQDVALALNASFRGAVATSVKADDEDVDIRVRFPEEKRRSEKALDRVMIANKMGGLIPLEKVTTLRKERGYSSINRLDYKRILQVQSGVDPEIVTSIEVNRRLREKFADIEARYPGYSVNYGGEDEETAKRMGELGILFLFAMIVVYIILAVFMDSLILPVVVMCAIPFSLIGVVTALATHGEIFSFMSVLGMVSLSGIIVSNTLVLVEFINIYRREIPDLKRVLVKAGSVRLRPILLTSGTTIVGLIPTMYGMGGKDYFVAPLALAFGYGLIFATVITLVLIPCFYYIAEDLKGLLSRVAARFGWKVNPSLHSGPETRENTANIDNG